MEVKKVSAAAVLTGCFLFNTLAANAAVPAVVSNKPLSAAVVSKDKINLSDKVKIKLQDKVGKLEKPKKENEVKKDVQLKKTDKKKIQDKKEQMKENKKTVEVNKADKVEKDTKNAVIFAGVALPPDYKNISIFGDAVATKEQAVALIKENNPDVKLACSVEELVDLYWIEAEREGVRPDLAMAQAFVETGFFRYGGDVHHNQNNFCGLGTTGGGVKGASFKTPEIGVRAHIQHLLAYAQKKRPSTKIVDPRYELAHNIRVERGLIDKWYGLNGTWAMGSQYCEKIMVNYQRMLAMKADDLNLKEKKQDTKEVKDVKEKRKNKNVHKMRDLVEAILHEKN